MSGGKGVPKSKWSDEEENALKTGVERHGTGKWRLIQKDDELSPFLNGRSNVDLKDKWRNLTVGSNPSSSTPKKVKKETSDDGEEEENTPASKSLDKERLQELIMNCITTLKDKNGSNQTAMTKYIEENLEEDTTLPAAFKKHLQEALQQLVDTGALVKNKTLFKLPGMEEEPKPSAPTPKAAKTPGSSKRERTERTAPAAATEAKTPTTTSKRGRPSKAAKTAEKAVKKEAAPAPLESLTDMKKAIERKKKEVTTPPTAHHSRKNYTPQPALTRSTPIPDKASTEASGPGVHHSAAKCSIV